MAFAFWMVKWLLGWKLFFEQHPLHLVKLLVGVTTISISDAIILCMSSSAVRLVVDPGAPSDIGCWIG